MAKIARSIVVRDLFSVTRLFARLSSDDCRGRGAGVSDEEKCVAR